MKKIKSLLVMSGAAAAAVLAFSAPAQAGGYDDHDGDIKGNNSNGSTYNDCDVRHSSLIGDISLLDGLLGGDDYNETNVTVICTGGNIDD